LTPYASDNIRSLPQILKEKGYNTSFFHGAPDGSMGFLSLTKLLGIENYYGKTEYNNDADFDGTWGIWDEPFFQFFEQKLSSFKEPFFSAIFSVSSHEPFKLPEEYTGKFPKGPLPIYECMGYTDMALQKFFAKAAQAPWFKNTLFVISADHATLCYHKEYLNQWGSAAIPILLYAPGDSTMRGVDTSIIQQTDIMPTVLSYLHYNKPFVAFGENVFAKPRMNFAYKYSGEFSWFQDNYLLIFDGEKPKALYNYTKDRFLENDSAKFLPERYNAMTRNAKAFIQQYSNRLIQNRMSADK
ncbi:MAG: LTA synthase family protein, partial [Chitinophagaceae bacterium]|nr:LTA synthase family protein [Chitinophagaceae bacterium]